MKGNSKKIYWYNLKAKKQYKKNNNLEDLPS
jgi:hypothetical protein